jgi:hypothetical protein
MCSDVNKAALHRIHVYAVARGTPLLYYIDAGCYFLAGLVMYPSMPCERDGAGGPDYFRGVDRYVCVLELR